MFHLTSCPVGKSNSQDMTIDTRVEKEQPQVFKGEGEGLSGTSRSFVYLEGRH
jgi:hypothetical protein